MGGAAKLLGLGLARRSRLTKLPTQNQHPAERTQAGADLLCTSILPPTPHHLLPRQMARPTSQRRALQLREPPGEPRAWILSQDPLLAAPALLPECHLPSQGMACQPFFVAFSATTAQRLRIISQEHLSQTREPSPSETNTMDAEAPLRKGGWDRPRHHMQSPVCVQYMRFPRKRVLDFNQMAFVKCFPEAALKSKLQHCDSILYRFSLKKDLDSSVQRPWLERYDSAPSSSSGKTLSSHRLYFLSKE